MTSCNYQQVTRQGCNEINLFQFWSVVRSEVPCQIWWTLWSHVAKWSILCGFLSVHHNDWLQAKWNEWLFSTDSVLSSADCCSVIHRNFMARCYVYVLCIFSERRPCLGTYGWSSPWGSMLLAQLVSDSQLDAILFCQLLVWFLYTPEVSFYLMKQHQAIHCHLILLSASCADFPNHFLRPHTIDWMSFSWSCQNYSSTPNLQENGQNTCHKHQVSLSVKLPTYQEMDALRASQAECQITLNVTLLTNLFHRNADSSRKWLWSIYFS